MASRGRINSKFRLRLSTGELCEFLRRWPPRPVLFPFACCPPLSSCAEQRLFLLFVLLPFFFAFLLSGPRRVSIVPPSDGELALFNYGNYDVYDRFRCTRAGNVQRFGGNLPAFIGQIAKSNRFHRKLLCEIDT